MTEKGIPNLDVMDEDELREFCKQLQVLQGYAWWKANSIFERKSGNIQRALESEKVMDQLYKQLPDWAKW